MPDSHSVDTALLSSRFTMLALLVSSHAGSNFSSNEFLFPFPPLKLALLVFEVALLVSSSDEPNPNIPTRAKQGLPGVAERRLFRLYSSILCPALASSNKKFVCDFTRQSNLQPTPSMTVTRAINDEWDAHLVSIKLSERWRVARLKRMNKKCTKIDSFHLIVRKLTSNLRYGVSAFPLLSNNLMPDNWDVHLVSIKVSERWRVARLKSMDGRCTKIESWHLIDAYATSSRDIRNNASNSKPGNPLCEIKQAPTIDYTMREADEDRKQEAERFTPFRVKRFGVEVHAALASLAQVSAVRAKSNKHPL